MMEKSIISYGRQECVNCGAFIGDVPFWARKRQRFFCYSCNMKKLQNDNDYMRRIMGEIGEDY